MEKLSSRLPTQSIIYVLVCCAGVMVFVMLIILPARRDAAALDAEIVSLQARIEEQRILNPLFKTLFERARAERQSDLPTREKAKLSQDDLAGLTDQLQQMARANRLQIEELSPDVNSLAGSSGYMSVSLSANGNFLDFRNFLIALETIPSLELIETIEVQSVEGSRNITVRFWLAQE